MKLHHEHHDYHEYEHHETHDHHYITIIITVIIIIGIIIITIIPSHSLSVQLLGVRLSGLELLCHAIYGLFLLAP